MDMGEGVVGLALKFDITPQHIWTTMPNLRNGLTLKLDIYRSTSTWMTQKEIVWSKGCTPCTLLSDLRDVIEIMKD